MNIYIAFSYFVFFDVAMTSFQYKNKNKSQDSDFEKSAGNTGINLPHIMESDWLIAGNSHIGRE